jgi:hypothetical protein
MQSRMQTFYSLKELINHITKDAWHSRVLLKTTLSTFGNYKHIPGIICQGLAYLSLWVSPLEQYARAWFVRPSL